MPERDSERLEVADNLKNQIASEDILTPIQARAFVRGLQTAWHVPTIAWTDDESRGQLRDARRLLDAAAIYRKVEGRESEGASLCYRRAGELLEWLTRAEVRLETFVPLELLASASFQLGGLPAMAAALLGRLDNDTRGEALYSRFLGADFDGVISVISAFWKDHLDIADRDATQRILDDQSDDRISWYFTVELVRSIGAIADAIRSGQDQRLERGLLKLASLDNLAMRTLGDDGSIFVSLLNQVANAYKESSIYSPIRRLGARNPERAPRIEAFARKQFSRKRGILWASQQDGISRLLQDSSFALCTPTGSGKTLVANLALVKELLLAEEGEIAPLALYLVPSRALAGEVEAKLTSELGRDLIITGLYGGSDWGMTDYWLEADRPSVLIATVEKADALMRYLGPLLLRRLRILILDEAHQVVPGDDDQTLVDFAEHSNRSVRLESLVSRILAQAPELRRIALTAVAGGAASPVARWIEGRDEALPVGTNYRSTRQIIGTFETRPDTPGRMLLDIMNGRPLFVRGRDEPVYLRLQSPPMPGLPAGMRNSIYRFNELHVLWTALHLSDDNRRILISVAQQPEKTMRWYKEALELESWHGALTFTPPEVGENRARFYAARATCIDYCGEESHELALLDQGIATNHGQMPQRLRRLMTDLIERGICPIAVATATLTEGVNLPFDLIFLTSLKRRAYDSVNETPVVTPMSTAEFRNLSGRAGRPGSSSGVEGITLVALPTRPSSTAKSQLTTQQNQIKALRSEYNNLGRELLADEQQQAEVSSPLALLLKSISDRARDLLGLEGEAFLEWLEAALPPEISDQAGCAETAEESRLADSVDELDSILLSAIEEIELLRAERMNGAEAEEMLANLWRRTFSAYAAVQEAWLERAFVQRGSAIIRDIYPDAEERSKLYQYGFTPYVGLRFQAIEPEMRALIQGADDYGAASDEERLAIIIALGELIADDRGYGFRVRATATDQAILENWEDVLAWWVLAPNSSMPQPTQLRSWQRFVAENIEFRMGVAIGAVVARAWSEGVNGELVVPSLEGWKETTGLPWFGFWAKELLRWGTLDPFVAFALGRGLAGTRSDAAAQRPEFESWMNEEFEELEAEDFIDPQLFLRWERSLPQPEGAPVGENSVPVELDGTTGERGLYRVIPVVTNETINWIDPAGYMLARSRKCDSPFRGGLHFQDFELHAGTGQPYVDSVFSG